MYYKTPIIHVQKITDKQQFQFDKLNNNNCWWDNMNYVPSWGPGVDSRLCISPVELGPDCPPMWMDKFDYK